MENYTCEPCQEKGVSNNSISWCVICEEALCKECTDTHRAMKISRTHEVVDISNRPKLLDLFNKRCDKHGDLPFDYFCIDHDDLSCKECLAQSHRTCSKVLSIDVASKGAKQSQIFTDAVEQVNQILKSARSFTKDREANKKRIKQDVEDVKNAMANFKHYIISRLDSLEVNFLENLNTQKYKIISELDDEVKQSKQIEETMVAQKDVFDFTDKHGTELQAFVLSLTSRSDRCAVEKGYAKSVEKSKDVHLDFKTNNIFDDVESLGSIDIKEGPCKIAFVPKKEQQSQTPIARNQHLPSLLSDKEIKLKHRTLISGMTCTDSGLLLLSSFSHTQIIAYKDNIYKYIIDITHTPWDIAMIPDTNMAVVSSVAIDFIQLVDIEKRKVVYSKYLASSKQGGVAAISKHLYVGTKNGVYITNHDGLILKQVDLEFKPIYICLSGTGIIYGTDINNVYGVKPDGEKVFKYTSAELKGPSKCVKDNHGNVYVVGHDSNNVQRLKPDGSFIDIILSKKDGVNYANAICFDKNSTKFYVANNNSYVISVFTVVDK